MLKDFINMESNDNRSKDIVVYVVKRYQPENTKIEVFAVENYTVLLVKSGALSINLGNRTHELSAQDLAVLPVSIVFELLEVKERPSLYLISFTTEAAYENCLKRELVDWFELLISRKAVQIPLEDKDFLVISLIYKLLYYLQKDNTAEEGAELNRIGFSLFLYEMKYILHSRRPQFSFDGMKRREILTFQFFKILVIHCRKQHSVQFYAGALFVTPGYLTKSVKLVTGKTVKDLIVQAVLIEIRNLLENAEPSLEEIAADFEFSSLSNFSAFFKKHTKMSASDYRYSRFKNR